MIKKIQLTNFRCFDNKTVELSKLNYLYGNNGVGKTSILEGIELISKIQSNRTNTLNELIKKDSPYSSVIVDDKYKIVLSLNKKTFFIGNKEIKQEKDFISKIKSITINQDDISLIKGSPKERRDFLDIELSQLSSSYYKTLNSYKRILKQRNVLLKTLSISSDLTLLDVLGSQLCKYGIELMNERTNYINLLNKKIVENNFLENKIEIKYLPDVDKSLYIEKMNNNQKNDILYESTLIGPHKDDFVILFDDNKAQTYASSGYQKIIVIIIKFVLTQILKSLFEDNVILMIDDCFSDIDEINSNKIINNIPDVLVIITGQSENNLFENKHYSKQIIN